MVYTQLERVRGELVYPVLANMALSESILYHIARWLEVCLCLVLCCVEDSNPYQLSGPSTYSSVGRVLA